MLGACSATKFAVRGLTQAAAREFASEGITVNACCPGIVGTDMRVEIDSASPRSPARSARPRGRGIALGRAEKPDDVAALVSHLAGPKSDYMPGQAVPIDGGIVYR